MTYYTSKQNDDLRVALDLAASAHLGQVDKSGVPIIFHVMRVANSFKDDPTAAIVAVLHDVVEDSNFTLYDLRNNNFSEEIVEAVDALTHRPNETYMGYIRRLSNNPLAVKVKKADLVDNMDPDRQNFDGHQTLFTRHLEAYEFLTELTEVLNAA